MPTYEARATETTGRRIASESATKNQQRMHKIRREASFRLLNLRRKMGEVAKATKRQIMRHKIISSILAFILFYLLLLMFQQLVIVPALVWMMLHVSIAVARIAIWIYIIILYIVSFMAGYSWTMWLEQN